MPSGPKCSFAFKVVWALISEALTEGLKNLNFEKEQLARPNGKKDDWRQMATHTSGLV